VYDHVPKSANAAPVYLWMCLSDRIGNALRGFAEGMEVAQHGVLDDRLLAERLVSGRRVLLDAIDPFEDVD
jgi:hypothetical protein